MCPFGRAGGRWQPQRRRDDKREHSSRAKVEREENHSSHNHFREARRDMHQRRRETNKTIRAQPETGEEKKKKKKMEEEAKKKRTKKGKNQSLHTQKEMAQGQGTCLFGRPYHSSIHPPTHPPLPPLNIHPPTHHPSLRAGHEWQPLLLQPLSPLLHVQEEFVGGARDGRSSSRLLHIGAELQQPVGCVGWVGGWMSR